jgi:hypothetical protein
MRLGTIAKSSAATDILSSSFAVSETLASARFSDQVSQRGGAATCVDIRRTTAGPAGVLDRAARTTRENKGANMPGSAATVRRLVTAAGLALLIQAFLKISDSQIGVGQGTLQLRD